MAKQIEQFRSSFIGYDKTQVDSYISKIKFEGEKKLNQIKDEITDTIEKNEKINEELIKLKDKKASQNKSEELRKFLLSRLNNAVELLDKNSKVEQKVLKEESKRKESEIDDEIEKLNKLIKNTQENVDVLLKTVIRKNEGLPINEEKASEDRSEFRVIQYKENNKAKVKRMLQNENDGGEEESKVAVNGGSMSMLDDKNEDSKNVTRAVTQKKDIKKISEKDIIEERNTSFWDDEIEEENINIGKKEDVVSQNEIITAKKEEIPVKSEAILNSIDNMRNKYIVGKLAGEDLLSKNGELVISKNAVITENVVHKAERAGKLAELIINMTIPDTVK